jgi:decaprenylphospho-beta-D-erythro-pentofuranosid-2-ulose 2-reductase
MADARVDGVVVVGATSAIGRAVAAEMAPRVRRLVLAARDGEEARAISADLRVRHGTGVSTVPLEALDFASHAAAADACLDAAGPGAVGVVLCLGYLGEAGAGVGHAEAMRILQTNFTACVSLLEAFAGRMEVGDGGWICALSSVAGDRGRQSNYLYGAAKGGLTVYLDGLRNRLHPAGIPVVTVKPGFVDTRMTYGRPGVFLAAAPRTVARAVRRAVERRRHTVYVPFFWRPVMWVIRAVPEIVFKRMKL